MALKYRRTGYPSGIVEIAGFWPAWREQIPALPADPDTLNDDVRDAVTRTPITYERDGAPVAATLSYLKVQRNRQGVPVGLGTLIEKDEVPTRRGRCEVCGEYRDELVERTDASGLTGWACEHHDGLDIVCA